MSATLLPWIGLNVFILLVLVIDLGVLHRKHREPTFRDAMLWTGVWIGLALLFNLGIWYFRGSEAAIQVPSSFIKATCVVFCAASCPITVNSEPFTTRDKFFPFTSRFSPLVSRTVSPFAKFAAQADEAVRKRMARRGRMDQASMIHRTTSNLEQRVCGIVQGAGASSPCAANED